MSRNLSETPRLDSLNKFLCCYHDAPELSSKIDPMPVKKLMIFLWKFMKSYEGTYFSSWCTFGDDIRF
jgi:hypothetical protein